MISYAICDIMLWYHKLSVMSYNDIINQIWYHVWYCIKTHSNCFLHCPGGHMDWLHKWNKVWKSLEIYFNENIWYKVQDCFQDIKGSIIYSTQSVKIIQMLKLICIIAGVIRVHQSIWIIVTCSSQLWFHHPSLDICYDEKVFTDLLKVECHIWYHI